MQWYVLTDAISRAGLSQMLVLLDWDYVFVGCSLSNVAVVLMYVVTRVAKNALENALAENEDINGVLASPELPVAVERATNLTQPLIIKIDTSETNHEQWNPSCSAEDVFVLFPSAIYLFMYSAPKF